MILFENNLHGREERRWCFFYVWIALRDDDAGMKESKHINKERPVINSGFENETNLLLIWLRHKADFIKSAAHLTAMGDGTTMWKVRFKPSTSYDYEHAFLSPDLRPRLFSLCSSWMNPSPGKIVNSKAWFKLEFKTRILDSNRTAGIILPRVLLFEQ